MRKKITPEQVKIKFNKPAKGKSILKEIKTPRLFITPVIYDHENSAEYLRFFTDYYQLFSNPSAMIMFSSGLPNDAKYVQNHLRNFSEHWKKGYPASGFAIYNYKKEFVGNVTVELSDKIVKGRNKGATVEIWYALCPKFWGKGLGFEAIYSIAKCYLPEVMTRGYTFDSYPIIRLIATVHVHNSASRKILKNIGCTFENETIMKYGAERYFCSLWMKQIKNTYYRLKEKSIASRNVQKFGTSEISLAFSSFGQSSNTAKNLSRR